MKGPVGERWCTVVRCEVKRVGTEWWVYDANNSDFEYRDVGPYRTKAEAQEARIGLERFWTMLEKEKKNDRRRN